MDLSVRSTQGLHLKKTVSGHFYPSRRLRIAHDPGGQTEYRPLRIADAETDNFAGGQIDRDLGELTPAARGRAAGPDSRIIAGLGPLTIGLFFQVAELRKYPLARRPFPSDRFGLLYTEPTAFFIFHVVEDGIVDIPGPGVNYKVSGAVNLLYFVSGPGWEFG